MSSENTDPTGNFEAWEINPIAQVDSINYYFALVDLPIATDDGGNIQKYTIEQSGLPENGILSFTVVFPENAAITDPNKFERYSLPMYFSQEQEITTLVISGDLIYSTDGEKTTKKLDSTSKPIKKAGLFEPSGEKADEDDLPETYEIRYRWLQMDVGGYDCTIKDNYLLLFCKVPTSETNKVSHAMRVKEFNPLNTVICYSHPPQPDTGELYIAAGLIIDCPVSSPDLEYAIYKDDLGVTGPTANISAPGN